MLLNFFIQIIFFDYAHVGWWTVGLQPRRIFEDKSSQSPIVFNLSTFSLRSPEGWENHSETRCFEKSGTTSEKPTPPQRRKNHLEEEKKKNSAAIQNSRPSVESQTT